MRWVDFVKRYAEEHNLSYKKALSEASGPFKTHKKKQKYTEPKLRNSKKKPNEEDGGCHIIKKISVKKRLHDTVKRNAASARNGNTRCLRRQKRQSLCVGLPNTGRGNVPNGNRNKNRKVVDFPQIMAF